MPIDRKDRVRDQTTTTGTGPFTIGLTAPAGFRTFSVFGTGATVRYSVANAGNNEWEVGEGIWTPGANTLTRATIFSSSNSGSPVAFTAGTKTITCGPVAADLNEAATLSGAETLSNKTLKNPGLITQPLTDAITINWNAANGSVGYVTLGGNRTLANPSNLTPGAYYLFVTQDATGGRTLSYGSGFVHQTTPMLSTAAGRTDCLQYICDGAKLYGGMLVKDPGTGIIPAPPPPPVLNPMTTLLADGFPAKMLGTYAETYRYNGAPLSSLSANFNLVFLFNAQPIGTPINNSRNNVGNGSFGMLGDENNPNFTPAMVQAIRARGTKVFLTVGGANAGYSFTTDTQVTNFVNSFDVMYDFYGGLDGCDFNNFEANIGSDPAKMIAIAQQLRLAYGPQFGISAPPNPTSLQTTGSDAAMLKAMSDAGCLSFCGPQYYDWDAFKNQGFISNLTPQGPDFGIYTRNTYTQWATLLGAPKVMIGLSANYWGSYDVDGDLPDEVPVSYGRALTLAECVREFDAVMVQHPTMRGAFAWNFELEQSANNQFGVFQAGHPSRQYGGASANGSNVFSTAFAAKLQNGTVGIPSGTPAPSPPAPAPSTIAVASNKSIILQAGTLTDGYYLQDDRVLGEAGVSTIPIAEGPAANQYEQWTGVSSVVGTGGAVSARMKWRWPDVGTEFFKNAPRLIKGARPGFFSSGAFYDGKPVRLTDGSDSNRAPCGDTPGTGFLPQTIEQMLVIGGPGSTLRSSFDFNHLVTPTGAGEIMLRIFLQSAPEQTSGGQFFSSLSHEIQIQITNWGNYNAHLGGTNQRPSIWYDHDVTISNRAYRVYVNKDANGVVNDDFAPGTLNGAYGRTGYRLIAFLPVVTPMPATNLNLANLIVHCTTRLDSNGVPWVATTGLDVVSVEICARTKNGTADFVISNFKVGDNI